MQKIGNSEPSIQYLTFPIKMSFKLKHLTVEHFCSELVLSIQNFPISLHGNLAIHTFSSICFFDFQLIFLIFHKHEWTSWFQIMEFIELTHAKLIRALVGADIHDILFNIACLIFDWLCFLFVAYMRLFWICYWANFVFHRVLACYPGTLLHTYPWEFYGHACYW